ncbi:MAG: SPFH domain-containing protein, partial [Romboutsia sp.]|nr:SPFH domain-containing protein [Romboutsia sp.]
KSFFNNSNSFNNEKWLSRQFKKVIQWYDNETDLMFFRYDISHSEIMNGSVLIVNEGQVALVSNNGNIEAFTPGKYELITDNKPVVSSLKNIFFKFENTDKQTIFFVPTKQFLNNKWGTKYPINIVDPKFEQVPIRAFGTFGFKIDNPLKFLREVSSTNKEYTKDLIKDQLTSFIIEEFPSVVQKEQVSVVQISQSLSKISDSIEKSVNDNFAELGLVMTTLTIENINLPDELQDILNTRTSINMLGGLGSYTTVKTLDVMEKSVENESANSMAQAGVGVGMGMGMINQFMQGIGNIQSNQHNKSLNSHSYNPPSSSTKLCPSCNCINSGSNNFCFSCGYKILNKANICDCGQSISDNTKFCPNCGKNLNEVR